MPLTPLAVPPLPLAAVVGLLVGALPAYLTPEPPRPGAPARRRAARARRWGPVADHAISLDAGLGDPARGRRARRCARSTSRSRRASWRSSSGAPGRASRRCSARSAPGSRTSPAAPSPATCASTGGTPATTGRATSPTSSGSSGRTRSPGSSPTPSRRSSPTAWSSSACPRRRCASASRRPSTCSASPSCATPPCASCPAASSSGSPSGRCSPPTRASSCSTSRRRRSTRPAPRRCSPRSPGSSTTSRSRSSWPSTGSSGCCTTPTRSCTSRPDGSVRSGTPAELMVDSDIASPVVELGRYAGWSPLPLSVRDARRAAVDLRARLTATLNTVAPRPPTQDRPAGSTTGTGVRCWRPGASSCGTPATCSRSPGSTSTCRPGEVAAVMGRNGSGKSSLLWALQGSGTRTSGTVRATRPTGGASGAAGTASATVDPRDLGAGERRSLVGLVPQTAADLLYLDTVGAECDQADRESGAARRHLRGAPRRPSRPASPAAATPATSPRARSSRSSWRCSSRPTHRCCCSTSRPAAWTPRPRPRSASCCAGSRRAAGLVVVSTHDVEFVAECADRVVVMAGRRGRGRRPDRRGRRRRRPPSRRRSPRSPRPGRGSRSPTCATALDGVAEVAP